MRRRKETVIHRFFDDSVRNVLQALPALVSHDVLLGRKILLIELVDQISHAVRLEPERERQLVGRNRLEIIGAVEIGGAIVFAGTSAFEITEMLVGFHVSRPLKHHVLEEMREPGAARLLIRRPNVVPDIDRYQGKSVILREDDLESVSELVLLKRNVRKFLSVDEQRREGDCARERGKQGLSHGSSRVAI